VRGTLHANPISGDRLVVIADNSRILLDDRGNILNEEKSDRFEIFKRQPNGISMAVPGALYRAQVYSLDNGETWHDAPRDWPNESDRLFQNGAVLMLQDGRSMALSYKGYAHEFAKRIVFEEQPRLRISNSDGKIERWGEKVEAHCWRLLPEISVQQRIFALCQGGGLIVTEDGGETWNEDFVPGGDSALDEALDPSATTI
jgi:hypothetical protein